MKQPHAVDGALGDADDYDAADNLAGSIQEAFRVIRERMAAGGPGWNPHTRWPLLRPADPGDRHARQ
jgi:hypothetical protein